MLALPTQRRRYACVSESANTQSDPSHDTVDLQLADRMDNECSMLLETLMDCTSTGTVLRINLHHVFGILIE